MKDYAAEAVPRLAGQFYNSPKLTAMIKAIVDPLSVLEDSADDMTTDRWIDTAIGRQLDGCGYIVGVYRRGRTDEEYRVAIKFGVFVNVSNGTPTDMIRALKFLTQPSDTQYLEIWPATVVLFTNGFAIPPNISELMQSLAPAAISDVPVAVSYGSDPFRFHNEPVISNAAELFVHNGASYMTANGSDIVINFETINPIGVEFSELGGVAPSDLFVNDMYLDVGGPTLAVYNRNTTQTIGTDYLTGVFQP